MNESNNLWHYKNVILTNVRSNSPNVKDSFSNFRKKIYSQYGEDGIIEYIFKIINPISRYYVEFGAWDGLKCSNTANLRINKNWKGLLLEGNKEKVESTINRKEINLHHEIVNKNNINAIFKKYNVPTNFDLLSIDIDSNDYYVWENLTDYKPRIVVIETNPGIKNDKPLCVIEDKANIYEKNNTGNYFGANLHAFYNLAKKKGYELLTVERWNAFFIIKEEFNKFNIQPISKEKMLLNYCIVESYWANRNKYTTEPYYWKIV